MVKLQLEISHHITGFVHVQTNPYHSYDTQKTVKGARSKLGFCSLQLQLILNLGRNNSNIQTLRFRLPRFACMHQDPKHMGRSKSLQNTPIHWYGDIGYNSLHDRASRSGRRSGMSLHCALRQRAASPLRCWVRRYQQSTETLLRSSKVLRKERHQDSSAASKSDLDSRNYGAGRRASYDDCSGIT